MVELNNTELTLQNIQGWFEKRSKTERCNGICELTIKNLENELGNADSRGNTLSANLTQEKLRRKYEQLDSNMRQKSRYEYEGIMEALK